MNGPTTILLIAFVVVAVAFAVRALGQFTHPHYRLSPSSRDAVARGIERQMQQGHAEIDGESPLAPPCSPHGYFIATEVPGRVGPLMRPCTMEEFERWQSAARTQVHAGEHRQDSSTNLDFRCQSELHGRTHVHAGARRASLEASAAAIRETMAQGSNGPYEG